MEIKAVQKYIRMSPKKLRFITFLIKGMTPVAAAEKLSFVGKRGSLYIQKAIKSAIANAKQKGISEKDLIFKEIQINEGPRLKRWHAAARGMAKPYVRPMSHIRVVLESKEPKAIKEVREKLAPSKKAS